jgi:hypothetical protein
MDGRDGWDLQCGQTVENLLPFGYESAQLAGLRLSEQRLEIGTRNKDRFLRGRHDDAAERWILFERTEMIAQILHRRRVEYVRAGLGSIEGEHTNPVITDFAPDHGRRHCRCHRAHIGEILRNSKRNRRDVLRICLAPTARFHFSLGQRPRILSDRGPALKARFNLAVL